jgi:excisionase family DNA binding protein
MKTESPKLTLSVTEAARLLNVGRNQAYEAIHRGELPSIKIGKRILVPRAALKKLLGMTESPGEAVATRIMAKIATAPAARRKPKTEAAKANVDPRQIDLEEAIAAKAEAATATRTTAKTINKPRVR